MGCGSSRPTAVLSNHPQSDPHSKPSEKNTLPQKDENANTICQLPVVPESAASESAASESAAYESASIQEEKAASTDADLDLLEISFEKAASLRLSTPAQMWAAVKKTCSPNKKWVVEKNKSRRGWKTIRLFVSSTFKDFHVEREVLVKEVP